MATTKQQPNLGEKIFQIQHALAVPKGRFNEFGKFYYRSLEDVLKALKPLLKQHRLTMLFEDQLTVAGEGDAQRFYVVSTVCVIDVESGDSTKLSAMAREPLVKKGMDEAQISGTTSSYARKYALNALFLIDDAADADAMNNGATEEQSRMIENIETLNKDEAGKVKQYLVSVGLMQNDTDPIPLDVAVMIHNRWDGFMEKLSQFKRK